MSLDQMISQSLTKPAKSEGKRFRPLICDGQVRKGLIPYTDELFKILSDFREGLQYILINLNLNSSFFNLVTTESQIHSATVA